MYENRSFSFPVHNKFIIHADPAVVCLPKCAASCRLNLSAASLAINFPNAFTLNPVHFSKDALICILPCLSSTRFSCVSSKVLTRASGDKLQWVNSSLLQQSSGLFISPFLLVYCVMWLTQSLVTACRPD